MSKNENKKTGQIIGLIIAILCLGGLVFYSITSRKKSAYTIAFLNIPESVSSEITAGVKSKYVGSVAFVTLPENFEVTKKSLRDIDVLFTNAGATALSMEKYATPVSEKLLKSTYTTAIAKSAKGKNKNFMLPILLDSWCYETLKGIDTMFYLPIPETLDELNTELEKSKSFCQFPIFVRGQDDKTLLGFISVYTEAVYGSTVYKNLIDTIKERKTLSESMDVVLSETDNSITFNKILKDIKNLSDTGILSANWTSNTLDEEYFYMKEKLAYSNSILLSDHREIPLRTLANYNTSIFPKNPDISDHGIIAQEIVMISFNDRKPTVSLGKYFSEGNVQEVLSNVSSLAPCASQGGSYDTIADDARFYAAASSDGPLPDLYNACFTTTESAKSFTEQIRSFLK